MDDDKKKDGQQGEQEQSGGAEETKDGADQSKGKEAGQDGAKNGEGDKQERTFTQEQVTKMMTREKNQGRAAALKELGIDPKDTKAVAMVKALIESQKSEEQKAAEKAAAESAKQSEAEHRALVAEAKAEAMLLGVQPQYVDDIVTLALSKMTDDADLKTVIGEFKAKYPMWFGDTGDDGDKDKKGAGKKTGQKGTGSSVKSSGKDKDSETKGLGARLAAQRKTSSGAKSSYWGKK